MQLGDYIVDFESKLGSGRFSRVFRGVDVNGTPVAVKVFKTDWVEDAGQEVANLERLASSTSPCVLRHRAVLHNPHISAAPIIVYPLLGSDLLKLLDWRYALREQKLAEPTMGLPWWLAAKCAADILEGLGEYHRLGLIHCDVKPENLMLSRPFRNVQELLAAPRDSWHVVVADAGSALEVCECRGTNHGTDPYRAPEFVTQQSEYGTASDIASAGAVVFELRTRDHMYSLKDDDSDTDDDSGSGSDDASASSQASCDSELVDLQTDMRMCAKMQQMWGRFPKSMVKGSRVSDLIFNNRGGVCYAGKPPREPTIESVLSGPEYRMPAEETSLLSAFLAQTCALWPDRRLNAQDAGQHVWIARGLEAWPAVTKSA